MFLPLLLHGLLSLSPFVRAAVPGMSCHGHGVLILHDYELSWVGLVGSGWVGRPLHIPPRHSTKHLQFWQRGESGIGKSDDYKYGVECCSRLWTRPQGRALPAEIPDGTCCWDGKTEAIAIRRLQSSCQGKPKEGGMLVRLRCGRCESHIQHGEAEREER